MRDEAHAEFRVWAPGRRRVDLDVGGERIRLAPEVEGTHAAVVSARPGDRYQLFLDDEGPFPDPCSRSQPDGVRSPSEVCDSAALARRITPFALPDLEELVIYELHVGTFTGPGTFEAAASRFEELRELGVRAVELMPIATFAGERGWGYEGLYTWAPHRPYGTPEQFAALVDAAHRADLGVILDVVYNHLGPGAEAVTAFGPYFTSAHETPWGDALDYARRGVREWAIQNAEYWVHDFRVDGLRLDATHAIFDDSSPHVLTELAERVRRVNPAAVVISEMETGNLRPIEEWGHDAQWGDELHHAVHVLVTDEHEGYYEKYGTVADLARAYERPEGPRLVVCAQNHDQVGNRAFGDRLHGDRLRLAAFCSILSPGTPLIFMGEEYDEQHPFAFFAHHLDPAMAEATREGRKREFAAFSQFQGAELPDPEAESTFLASKLDPDHGDDGTRRYYRELLATRERLKGLGATADADEERRVLRVRRGDVELVMNFSDEEVDGVPPWSGEVRT